MRLFKNLQFNRDRKLCKKLIFAIYWNNTQWQCQDLFTDCSYTKILSRSTLDVNPTIHEFQGSYTILNINFQTFSRFFFRNFCRLTFSEWPTQVTTIQSLHDISNRWCRRRGCERTTNALIWGKSGKNQWKSSKNPWKSGQTPQKYEQKWRPTCFDLKNWRRKSHENRIQSGPNFFRAILKKSGKNLSYPQKFACFYTYVSNQSWTKQYENACQKIKSEKWFYFSIVTDQNTFFQTLPGWEMTKLFFHTPWEPCNLKLIKVWLRLFAIEQWQYRLSTINSHSYHKNPFLSTSCLSQHYF